MTECDRIVTENLQNVFLQGRFQKGSRSFLTPPRGIPPKEAHILENQGRLKCSGKSGLRHLIGDAFFSGRLAVSLQPVPSPTEQDQWLRS